MKTKYKPYAKVINLDYGLCAIYEPHPFRSCSISEAVGSKVDTGIKDDEWTCVIYDYVCNPIGLSDEKPKGMDVDMLKVEDLDLSWTTSECAQNIVDYLNKEYWEEIK